MFKCLGLYIENNLIKYAKLSKNKDYIKLENYGVKFYDNINEAIEQIIQETSSYVVPISINLTEELYNYFEVFSSLSSKDFKNMQNTSFEMFCEKNNLNSTEYKSRYLSQSSDSNSDKEYVINIIANKRKIDRNISNVFSNYKVTSITPISLSILNLFEDINLSNSLVVNLEDDTTVTLFKNKNVHKIIKLKTGMKEVFSKLSSKVNSISKAYEILKECTIYTEIENESTDENYEYLSCIMPVLYSIIENIQKETTAEGISLKRIYLTGTGTLINNIDLYFSQMLDGVSCEIIKPFFLENVASMQTNIKDYIEVNSAIALALDGIENGIKGINFCDNSDNGSVLKKEISIPGIDNIIEKIKKKNNFSIKNDFGKPFDKKEKALILTSVILLSGLIIYGVTSKYIEKKTREQYDKTNNYIVEVESEINKINTDIGLLENKKNSYTNALNSFVKSKDDIIDKYKKVNIIPNFLNKIMYITPTQVVIKNIQIVNSNEDFSSTNISQDNSNVDSDNSAVQNIPSNYNNDTERSNNNSQKVQIILQSAYFDELGAFIAKLKNGPDGEGPMLSSIKVEIQKSTLELTTIKITGELN